MNPAISIENVRKTLGKREILKDISFDVERGDIFGYLGPNGAGKTTTIRILLGLFKADSGILKILGHDINLSETRRKIGFVLDSDGLYDSMSAEENMQYYARLYGLFKAEKRISELLATVKLENRAKDKIYSYSKGMKQRLALARAMVHDPEVLILDEPTSGVDPSGQIEIREIMIELAQKRDKTIFLSSHNLDEVQKICSRIALIDNGAIKLYGNLDSLRSSMGKKTVIIETSQYISEPLLLELKGLENIGLKEIKENRIVFLPKKGTEISEIISILAGKGIKIEKALKKESTLEEMYSSILRETEPS